MYFDMKDCFQNVDAILECMQIVETLENEFRKFAQNVKQLKSSKHNHRHFVTGFLNFFFG